MGINGQAEALATVALGPVGSVFEGCGFRTFGPHLDSYQVELGSNGISSVS